MKITCHHCKEEFTASNEQSAFITASKVKNMKFIIIECPICYESFHLDPTAVDRPVTAVSELADEDGLRCPNAGCFGIISFIEEEKPFWGCGECGTVWNKKSELFQDVKISIEKYPYRAEVYKKKRKGFIPAALEDEPEDYEDLVLAELNK
ncbi:transcription elongation factor Elf1 [Chryseobacterium sp. H1D6B]|uniref:hypothetical protein n=1 Tax=Chryseobacterium sp. H1D6B TaxID=2940588 RepID=UPI0015C6B1D9|nr:hypothetical protein [Chryseobacterium sp. H1D6B]MDH6254438.1 transcription elongation factor Elf1 [Chryseobacterium sp. H1D6B]